ncbi:MAG TPA: hypothetical protein VLA21_03085 [Candidatus Limnocylindria bacterium]|nr:hypothetical protein [Candidatus Limnocylindria bacterium]
MGYQVFGAVVCLVLACAVYAFSVMVYRSMIGHDIMERRKRDSVKYCRMRRVGFRRWLLLPDLRQYAKGWHYTLYIIHFPVGLLAVILLTASTFVNNRGKALGLACGLAYMAQMLLVAVPLYDRFGKRRRSPVKPYGKA